MAKVTSQGVKININDIKDNEIYETEEFLNGKKVYAKRLITTASMPGGNPILEIQHGLSLDLIDIAWIDMSNSFIINKLSDYLRCLPLVQTYYTNISSNAYFSATLDKDKVILMSNGGWGETWTKVVTIKFTYR